MQPAQPARQTGSDLAQTKLRSEILKLKSERLLLRRQLSRADRPTWWEVVKTVVPWISLAVGALAFATGYVQSLRQERQRLLQVAMGHYLGNHPEVGASLLRELVTGEEGARFLSPEPPDVPLYLIQGIDIGPKDPRTDVLNHRRNLAALQVLTELAPPLDPLCAKCSAAGQNLDRQLGRERLEGPAGKEQQDETRRSTEFICQCGDLLAKLDPNEERCKRETWKEVNPTVPLHLADKSDCVRRTSPRSGSGSSGASPAGSGKR